jgi:hypothetical protein
MKQRKNTLDILLEISPTMLVRNSDLTLFKLVNLLSEPLLFSGTMQFLNRLLLIKDEQTWINIAEQLSQGSEQLLNSDQLATIAKAQFVDFVLQVTKPYQLFYAV